MKKLIISFQNLLSTIKELRGENGCPWDKKQTTASLEKYLKEEFEEILRAVENADMDNLCEELGDFLYLIIMLAEINESAGHFSMTDVVRNIDEKLIRRHPHVFGDSTLTDEAELKEQWQKIKELEKNN